MAHWIIDDHGFGGQFYTCSVCGEGWWDILDNPERWESCPNCKDRIYEDETEYIEKAKPMHIDFIRKYMWKPYEDTRPNLRDYEYLENKLIQVSGCSIEKLIELFAAGYTLTPPRYDSKTMSTLMKLEEGED